MSKYSISIIAQYTIYEMYASHGLANSDELFCSVHCSHNSLENCNHSKLLKKLFWAWTRDDNQQTVYRIG